MNQEEIKKHSEYSKKRQQLAIKQGNFTWGSVVFLVLSVVLLFEREFLLAVISFILFVYLFAKFFQYETKISELDEANELLDLKMKGYKKQLSQKGVNVNINSNENQKTITSENSNGLKDKLKEFEKLKNEGILNEEEYEAKRKQIIEKY